MFWIDDKRQTGRSVITAANSDGTSVHEEQMSSKSNENPIYFKIIAATIVMEYASRHLK